LASGNIRVSVKRAFCIIYLLSILTILSGQNYPIREYTVRDGLPHNQVKQITQDSRGFLWIVTRNGISRFDGVEFRNYFRKDGLLSNVNNNIFEDNAGNVWVLESKGLSKYDGYRFKSFPYSGDLKPEGFTTAKLLNDTIFLTIPNHKPGKILWFDGETFHDYSQKHPALANLNVIDLNYDRSSGYYFLHEATGTWKWKYGSLSLFADQKMSYRLENGRLLFYNASGHYIPDGDGLAKISPEKLHSIWYNPSWTSEILINDRKSSVNVTLPAPSIPFIDREDNVWFHSEMNLYRLVSTAFSYLSAEDGLPPSTWAIAEDAEGRFWFGSLFGDLMKYEGNRFIPQEYCENRLLSNPGFYKGSIRQSNGDVLFTTGKGVFRWDGRTFSTITKLNGIQVCVSYEDPVDKSVLFGTDAGLFHFKNGKMDIYPEFSSPGLGVVEGIAADGEGRYWLSGQKGIVLHDRSGSFPVNDPALPEGYTYTIVKDSFGGIWVSSEEGLFVKPDSSSGFRNGLPPELNTTANVVAEMDSQHIIVGRNLDICIIDLQKFHSGDPSYFKIYDSSSGYPGNDCLDHGIVKDRNGKFWILTAGKVVILDPQKLKTNNNPPALHFTEVRFQSDSMQWKVMEVPGLFYHKQGTVKLTHRQNSLKFSFAGISMSDPLKVTYQYRLLGNGESWSAKSSSREAAFSNLPPGRYEFQLRGFNADGVVTPGPLSLKLIITPAFWQRIIFQAAVLILIALILIRITIHIVRKNVRRKAEEDRIKNELTRLQMNSIFKQFEPHFTYNVISSAGSLILNGERGMAYDYLVKFSELLRSILTDGSMIIRTLADEIKFVTNYCELQEMRFKERLSWRINIHEDVNMNRQVPGMTIQTFVENSIKHGFGNRVSGGSISIDISDDNGRLVIKITDNGIGRKAAEQVKTGKSGHGLKTILSIYSFMNKMNRENATIEIDDLYDSHNNPAGTSVTIKIPDDYIFKPGKNMPLA
jgi:hypothetical protein